MASTTVIKEFLVSLGVKIETEDWRRFNAHLSEAGKAVTRLGSVVRSETRAIVSGFKYVAGAVSGAVAGTAYAIERLARSFFNLYFASQRIGASAESILAMRYAGRQIGLGYGEIEGQAQSLFRTLRQNPGLEVLLRGMFGVQTRTATGAWRESTEILKDLTRAYGGMLAKGQEFVAAPILRMLGLDDETIRQMALNRPELERYEKDYREKLKAAGVDTKQLANNSKTFIESLQSVWATSTVIFQRLVADTLPFVSDKLADLDRWLTANTKDIADGLGGAIKSVINWLQSVDWVSLGKEIKSLLTDVFTGNWKKLAEDLGLKWLIDDWHKFKAAIAEAKQALLDFWHAIPGHESFEALPGANPFEMPEEPKGSWLWDKIKKAWTWMRGKSAPAEGEGKPILESLEKKFGEATRGEKAVLEMIAKREGAGPVGEVWNMLHSTREHFKNLAEIEAQPGTSHAFGIFGFQPGTYRPMAKRLGFDPNDISPEHQYRAALELGREVGWNAPGSWQESGVLQGRPYPEPREWERLHPEAAKPPAPAKPATLDRGGFEPPPLGPAPATRVEPPPLVGPATVAPGRPPGTWPGVQTRLNSAGQIMVRNARTGNWEVAPGQESIGTGEAELAPEEDEAAPAEPPATTQPGRTPPPITGPTVPSMPGGGHTFNQHFQQGDINVTAGPGADAAAIGRSVRFELDRSNADLVRNLRGAMSEAI